MKSVSRYEDNEVARNDTAAEKQKRRIANEYLPKAIDVVAKMMTDEKQSPRLRFDAAKWLAEQAIGKPKEMIETITTADSELSILLASALRNLTEDQQRIKVVDAINLPE